MRNKSAMQVTSTWVWVVVWLLCAGISFADGDIDSSHKQAWASQAGWMNFKPILGGVTVLPDGLNGYLKGFAWAENIGWIKLGAGDGIDTLPL